MHVEYVLLALCLTVSPTVRAQIFTLEDSYAGYDFLNEWTFETFDDPTHGDVDYFNQELAYNDSMIYGAFL
jgi:hypothetical protein